MTTRLKLLVGGRVNGDYADTATATEFDNLLDAINGGEISGAERLIGTGLDLNNPCDQVVTPSYAAIINGHHTLVQ